AQKVNGAREDFFAGAGLPGDQDREIRAGTGGQALGDAQETGIAPHQVDLDQLGDEIFVCLVEFGGRGYQQALYPLAHGIGAFRPEDDIVGRAEREIDFLGRTLARNDHKQAATGAVRQRPKDLPVSERVLQSQHDDKIVTAVCERPREKSVPRKALPRRFATELAVTRLASGNHEDSSRHALHPGPEISSRAEVPEVRLIEIVAETSLKLQAKTQTSGRDVRFSTLPSRRRVTSEPAAYSAAPSSA